MDDNESERDVEFTYVVGCDSVSIFILQSAHIKLPVVLDSHPSV